MPGTSGTTRPGAALVAHDGWCGPRHPGVFHRVGIRDPVRGACMPRRLVPGQARKREPRGVGCDHEAQQHPISGSSGGEQRAMVTHHAPECDARPLAWRCPPGPHSCIESSASPHRRAWRGRRSSDQLVVSGTPFQPMFGSPLPTKMPDEILWLAPFPSDSVIPGTFRSAISDTVPLPFRTAYGPL